MPTLAFYKSKGGAADQLLQDLMRGLTLRLQPDPAPRDFQQFIGKLQTMDSGDYQRYTDESLELLKWIRQFVDAVER